ncbi:MAG TPA: plastocyanin/azurin family copper-binding protein, partial [Solirubrobacterales bacterium]
MKKVAALLILALSALALPSCGDEEATPSTRNEATTGVETTRGLRGDVATGGGGRVSTVGKGASEIHVVAAPQGLAYETQEVTIEAGETLLHFENPQSEPHDVDLENDDGKLIADMETIAGGYADVPIKNLEAGEYIFYCS